MNNIQELTLDGHKARFMHISNPDKPAIVVLPGNLQEIESIQLFNNGLSTDFDYYAIEVPGTGLTEPLHASYPIAYQGNLLKTFVETVVKQPIYLLAVSYSTPIALEFAKSNPWLLGLTLAGSMKETPVDRWGDVFSLLSSSLKDRSSFSTEFINSLTVEDDSIPRWKAVKKSAKLKAKKYSEDQFWCFIQNSLRFLVYKPQNLDKIRCPTFCFTGDRDPYVTPTHCRELSKLIPGAVFKTIENTDHLFMIEKPEETTALVREFFLSLSHLKAA